MTKIIDRLGRVREFTYFDDNLLNQETWKDTDGGAVVWTRSFTWDANDQLLTATDNNGTYTLTYDELNRVATIQDPWTITLTNTWDAGDRLTQVTDTKGGTRDYIYDDANRNTVRKFSATGQAARLDITYNDRNDVTEVRRYTDLAGATLVGSTVYVWDDARRLTSITHKNAAAVTIDLFTYLYRSFAATEGMNRTALSNLKMFVSVTRKEQGREVFSSQAWRQGQWRAGMFRSRHRARPFTHGGARILLDLAVFQEDRPELAVAA